MNLLAFINDDDVIQKWKYHVAEFKVFVNNKEYDLKTRLKSFNISHNYETHLYPIFQVQVVMDSDVYYDIMKYKDTAQFHVRIQKYYRKLGKQNASLYRDYINDKFNLILDDSDFDVDKTIKEEKNIRDYKKTKQSTYNDLVFTDNIIELFLFKKEYNEKMNMMVNELLQNATVSNAIQYLAGVSGLRNILMSIPDNTTEYSPLIIPPLKIKDAIRWIDTYYGFYKTGMLFYIDSISNIIYILKYDGKCTAYMSGEIKDVNIMIPKRSSKYTSELGGLYRYKNNDGYYIIANNSNMSIRNETVSYNMIDAMDAVVVDSYTGDISKLISNGETPDSRAVRVINNKTENKWYGDIYTTTTSSKSIVIDAHLGDYDTQSVTPNKRCKLLFQDSDLSRKYNGDYKIMQVNNTFNRDGADFQLNSIIKFKRLK